MLILAHWHKQEGQCVGSRYLGQLFYSYADFGFFKEIDTWIEVKPQVVVGSVTIMFNSFRGEAKDVWAEFHGPNQTRLRSGKWGKSAIILNQYKQNERSR